jgi:DnaJ-class molecular chaperone
MKEIHSTKRREICEPCRGYGYFLFDGKNEVCYACLGNGYLIYEKTEEK